MTQNRSRNWCFTINNYVADDLPVTSWVESKKLKCVAFSYEIGESGTPHLQGFICYQTMKSFKQVKSDFCNKAHLEAMKGAVEHSVEYCSKAGPLTIFGTVPMSQKQKGSAGKKAYEDAWEHATRGNLDEIDVGLRVRFYGTFKRIAKDYMGKPCALNTLDNEWIYGPTGTGKSRHTRERFPGAYYKMPNKWWDGYQGEEVVIIEDFDAMHDKLGYHLKIWADHGFFLAEQKGGVVSIRPKKIVITSNYEIRDIWNDKTTYGPLERRFKSVFYGEEKKKELEEMWAARAAADDEAIAAAVLSDILPSTPVPSAESSSPSIIDLVENTSPICPPTIPASIDCSPIAQVNDTGYDADLDLKFLDDVRLNLWPEDPDFVIE